MFGRKRKNNDIFIVRLIKGLVSIFLARKIFGYDKKNKPSRKKGWW